MASTIEIKVPALGESVSEATVAQWLKKKGDPVALDETILELETEKVTLEVNAPVAGILSDIKANTGDTVGIGDLLGLIAEGQGQAAPAKAPTDSNTAATEPSSHSKVAEAKEESPSINAASKSPSSTEQTGVKAAAPAAAKIAAEQNIDVSTIPGTGKDGRVTKQDVLAFSARSPNDSNQSPTMAAPAITLQVPETQTASRNADPHPAEERVKMTRLRKTIAARLKEAQNTAAMLTTFNEVDMTNIMAARKHYKDLFEKKHDVKLGFMSFFVKACVLALKEIPAVNAEIDGDDLVYKNHYDIGVAVSTPQGLIVPVLRDADRLGFAEVEKNIADLGHRARKGKLSMADLSGGTFTITNGGIFGSLMSTPILNPPQSGILGMHKIQERPMVIKGEIQIRPMMYIALTYDHRIIDGREAVTFLVRVKECLENPERILLDI
jgi:2-oxoglutarate dehydrogenase E2 component (dihydrolipoamide succinyltransferase)